MGFLSSLAGGVCCWNIFASWLKFLLGNFLGVWAGVVGVMVVAVGSGFGLGVDWVGLVSTGFGLGLGVFFLVDLANPWCLMRTSLESTFTNCC